jgi:bacteriocin-like protein
MMKKLTLKKKIITVLSDNEMQSVNGGGTTSYSNCSGFACCNYQGCQPASQGTGTTCLISCPTPTLPPPV